MVIRQLTSSIDLEHYAQWLGNHPHATLWQSLPWKRYQEALGRQVRAYTAENERQEIIASALVVIDTTSFGLSTWDIPRGPLGLVSSLESRVLSTPNDVHREALIRHVIVDAEKEKCLCLSLSPVIPLKTPDSRRKTSLRHEQPEASRIIDLTQSSNQILAQMHPKGRYNIGVAEKHGLRIEESTDIDAFYKLLRETGGRDCFTIGPKRHYDAFLRELPGAFLLLAYLSDQQSAVSYEQKGSQQTAHSSQLPIAGLLGVIHGKTGIYYYGASSYSRRALMAPFLLQWKALERCKALGCLSYDLLGVAPANAASKHPWEGISAFKAKFGGHIVSYPPEQQIILRPVLRSLLRAKRKVLG